MLSARAGYIVNTFLVTMGLAYIADFVVLSYAEYSIPFIPLLLGVLTGSIMIGLLVRWD